jgi:hypothetical protein
MTLNALQWVCAVLGALMAGLSKTALGGLGALAVALRGRRRAEFRTVGMKCSLSNARRMSTGNVLHCTLAAGRRVAPSRIMLCDEIIQTG